MPGMLGTPTTIASLDYTFIDVAGKIAHTGIKDLTSAPSGTLIDNLGDAMGNISNAYVQAYNLKGATVSDPASVVVFDEAYASANTKLRLVFENPARRKKYLEIPAPDASIFASDGETVDYSNTDVLAVETAFKAIAGSTYSLKRGFLGNRTRKQHSANRPPAVREPTTGDLPAGVPALPAP